MIFDTFLFFLFAVVMMVIIGAVPVMIVSIGNKSRNDRTRLGSSEKILQLEQRIEELENELKGSMKRRIENLETIITENEYHKLDNNNIKMIEDQKSTTENDYDD